MNILKNIKLTGEVFSAYAFLTLGFFFENKESSPISTEYMFALPKDALISDVKILMSNGDLIRTKITTVSHATSLCDLSVPSAAIRKIDDNTYSLNLFGIAEGECAIFVSFYKELSEDRLTIPFCQECSLDVDIEVKGKTKIISPTHNMEFTNNVKTQILANRDFCLTFLSCEQKNSAIATTDAFGGQMLIKVFLDKPFIKKFKKAVFVLYPDLAGGRLRCAKEFILCSSKLFEEISVITYDGVLKDKQDLLKALSNLSCAGRFDLDKVKATDDALCIIVSQNTIEKEGFFNVTIDDYEGKNHIFAGDNIEKRSQEIIKSLSRIKPDEIETDATVVSLSENSATLFLSYKGAMPKEIKINGQKIAISKISIYKSFAPIQLVMGKIYCEKEEKKLILASDLEIIKIRKNLEKIGVAYSFLNSETTLFAVLCAKKTIPLRVVMPPKYKRSYSAFEERYSMFEELDSANKKDLATAAFDIIIRSIRADGAICADGEINIEYKKKQTLICILALIFADFKNANYLRAAKDFLGDFTFNNIYFTEDKKIAKELLDKFFAAKGFAYKDYVPDIITAANIIRLFW